jgi:hypothetical protein
MNISKPNLDSKLQEWRVLQDQIKKESTQKVAPNKKHAHTLNSASCILPKATEAVIEKEPLEKDEDFTSARIEIVRKSVSSSNPMTLTQKKRNLNVIKTVKIEPKSMA